MKIYISLDAEGCSQLVKFSQVEPESREYNECRIMMLHDVNCLIRGARSAGARTIHVCDAHELGVNLPAQGVDADAVLRGAGNPFSMMAGLEEGFDCAFFAGYHARNSSFGVMSHTYYPKSVEAVLFDGKPVGEFEINAALAAYFHVPAGLISGDDMVCSQASSSCPWLVQAEVKRALGASAACCFHQKTCARILFQAARNAVQKAKQGKLQCAPLPKTAEIIFKKEEQAQKAFQSGCKPSDCDKRRVLVPGSDYREQFLLMIDSMEKADAI
ncbi:MAG: M55 family metallopeptidase [Christensenellales bacterium]